MIIEAIWRLPFRLLVLLPVRVLAHLHVEVLWQIVSALVFDLLSDP